MSFLSTSVIAFSMSSDAFAASLAKGAALGRPGLREALRTGLIFGGVETLTPLLGWAMGRAASGYIESIDHWVAYCMLTVLGTKMIYDAFSNRVERERPASHTLPVLVLTAIGTSIDAMAIGVTLALIDANIIINALAIGGATFVMTTLGMLIGQAAGTKFGRYAEAIGGAGLMVIGAKILVDHTLLG